MGGLSNMLTGESSGYQAGSHQPVHTTGKVECLNCTLCANPRTTVIQPSLQWTSELRLVAKRHSCSKHDCYIKMDAEVPQLDRSNTDTSTIVCFTLATTTLLSGWTCSLEVRRAGAAGTRGTVRSRGAVRCRGRSDQDVLRQDLVPSLKFPAACVLAPGTHSSA